jgi:hypothetical protein
VKNKKCYYVQCKLQRITGEVQITWLPEQFAKKGSYLRLYNEDKVIWENGWLVVECYREEKQPAKEIEKGEQDYKKQRQVSDI